MGKSDKFIDTQGSLNSEILPVIRKVFPDLNMNWLLFDEGEMIKTAPNPTEVVASVHEDSPTYGKDYKQLYLEALEENRELHKENKSLLKRIDSFKKPSQQISIESKLTEKE